MAETNKLPINRHYPLPSNSSLVLLEVACAGLIKTYICQTLVSRNNTDRSRRYITNVICEEILWKFLEKNSYLICLIGFPHFLSSIFFQCGTVSRAIFWPWEWESHIKDDGTKKHKESGSPVISWAITPADCQPLNSPYSTKISKPLIYLSHCLVGYYLL